MEKKIQTLRSKNLLAANNIYEALKEHKSLSFEEFKNEFFMVRDDLGYGHPWSGEPTSPNNWQTTEKFLKQRGIMTTHLINGFRFYIATQKCVRTKNFENACKI